MDIDESEVLFELAAQEIRDAVRRSLAKSSDGSCLIQYHELPDKWRSNPYVVRGYRLES